LPFILTVAVAPACDDEKTSNPPPPKVEPPGTSAALEHDNPPPPDPDAKQPENAPEQETGAGAGNQAPIEVARDNSRVERNADGTCTRYVAVDCPEGVKCNPPPPQQVDCPDEKDLPEAPKTAGDLFVDKQGYCNFVREVKCPPNVPCNPPVPERVRCPKGFTGS
jgi:hypothetical protein